MHLLEIMSTPITYVEMALVLFLSVFISVLVREAMRSRVEVAQMASLPLQEELNSKEGVQ